jgi:hypothetical protein
VQKESAAIRASFREESHDSNVRYAYTTTIKGNTRKYAHKILDGTMSPNYYTSSRWASGHILDRSNV